MSEKIVEISEESLMWIDERYNRLREENKQLHSIIKEVREYIEDNACYSDGHCKCSFSQMEYRIGE